MTAIWEEEFSNTCANCLKSIATQLPADLRQGGVYLSSETAGGKVACNNKCNPQPVLV